MDNYSEDEKREAWEAACDILGNRNPHLKQDQFGREIVYDQYNNDTEFGWSIGKTKTGLVPIHFKNWGKFLEQRREQSNNSLYLQLV